MNLYEKLNKISEETREIEKKGHNADAKYKYVRAVDVFEEVQKLLIKHKVNLSITEKDIRREKHEKNYHSLIKCEATFTNIEEPDQVKVVEYYSVSADTLDKDIFKAKTNGLKYLFTQQFLIVTKDVIDTEQDAPRIADTCVRKVPLGKSEPSDIPF